MTAPADQALIDTIRDRLNSAVVSDILDALGHREHALDPRIVPLDGASRLVGPVMTVRVEEVSTIPEDPYRGEIAALDDLRDGEVAFVAGGATGRAALWGELFSNAARARGAAGVVIDGLVRDRAGIRAVGFPVFARGSLPLDCNGRTAFTGHRVPVTCCGLLIHDGDVLVADDDGIVLIPSRLLAKVVEGALAKVDGENRARDAIRGGMKMREAFDTFRVL